MSLESLAADAVLPGSGEALKAMGFIRRHGPGILMGLALVAALALLYWAPWAEARGRHSRDLEVAGLNRTISDMKAAEAKAAADAAIKARGIETAQTSGTEGSNHEIEDQRNRALSLAAGYLAQLRTKAAAGNPGGANAAGGPAGAPGSSGLSAGAGGVSVLDADDVRICTENTVKALGVLPWWEKMHAIPR
jgi:hypothetical protein